MFPNLLKQTGVYLIVGLGRTGLSIGRFLKKNNRTIAFFDTRLTPPCITEAQNLFPDVPVFLNTIPWEILSDISVVVVSPGIDFSALPFADKLSSNVPVVGDIELFAHVVSKPVIGVTGSNGKGTVVTLVSQMLKHANYHVCLAGNIGLPVLDTLDDMTYDYYVLELSSFQLETTFSLALEAAVILNVSPDHLDRYKDMEAYQAAKLRIFHHCRVPILNRDESTTTACSNSIGFGIDHAEKGDFCVQWEKGEGWLSQGEKRWMPLRELKIKGRHNWSNALAALALTEVVHCPMDARIKALQTFQGLEHRCQYLGTSLNQVDWYDDSKATNIGASIAAIEGLASGMQGKIILIAGGQGKGQDFSLMLPTLRKHVRSVVLLGECAEQLNHIFSEQHPHLVKDMTEAVHCAAKLAVPNDIVLLAPACASLDMFQDYAERGRVFKSLAVRYFT